MSEILHIFVRWPHGETLPVEAYSCATGASLRSLVQLTSSSDNQIVLVFRGVRLDDEKTLAEQGVSSGDEFTVERQTDDEKEEEMQRKRQIQEQIRGMYREVLRLQDIQLDQFDTEFVQQFNSMKDDASTEGDYSDSDSETWIPIKTEVSKPSTKPLPVFWEPKSYADEEERPEPFFAQFQSIDQASSFFNKEGWHW
ncbi:Ubiquitin family protein [Trichomonas vaginalis G3]|uniref:Ubiquitin family protein n=1 Tax=Trichomonas vaginalis (strain ATCC PRA-98 / G3) TaxID=412133 RepID=A2DAC3_TRIV3|nr:Ubl ubiquitin like domain-containing protein [Trichomonas vaginalis G3]EAY22771.1 Ubiquitin family protein [Trichomonas vaginalis G3]KAI5525582.1 Ubl ubiquitin like domain-containing protein [Trichomonas vaginalis G3]|eukprot:XP_001583757.1 Ubiquitin family protein [Trichomonas vaginalis G3]